MTTWSKVFIGQAEWQGCREGGLLQADGHQGTGLGRGGDPPKRSQRGLLHDRGIVEGSARDRAQITAELFFQRGGLCPRFRLHRRGGQGLENPGRHRPGIGRKEPVAGTQGKTILLAHGGVPRDADREFEIPDHPPDDGELLPVLLPEDRDVGPDDLEEHRHDGADPVEVTRALRSLEAQGETLSETDREASVTYICRTSGRKSRIHTLVPAKGRIGAEGTRVAGKILLGSELRRVDEDRDGHGPSFARQPARPTDQGGMPCMEGSHGGDEDDLSVDFSPPGGDGSGRDRRDHAPTWRGRPPGRVS